MLSEMEDRDRARNLLQGLHIETETVDTPWMEYIKKLLTNMGSLKTLYIEAKFKTKLCKFRTVRYQLTNVIEISLINVDIRLLMLPSGLLILMKNLQTLAINGCGELHRLIVALKHSENLMKLNLRGNNSARVLAHKA